MRVELNVDLDEHSYNVQLECDASVPLDQIIANAAATIQSMVEATALSVTD